MTSCNKAEEAAADKYVRLNPIITKALSLNFREGDKIGVNINMEGDGGVYASNEMMTYDGNSFSSDLKWYKDGASKCTVTAWYPYTEAGFPSTFSVALDQSKGTEASDFMLAVEKGVYPSSNAVLAKFHHQLSQINVVIKADFDVDIESVQIKNVIPEANLTFREDGSLDVTADEDASKVDITAEEITAGKLYSAVLVPQDLSGFGLSIKVRNGNTIVSGINDASLKQGYAYTITATVTAEEVTAGIAGEIADWEDGGNLDSGDYKVPFEEHEGYFIYDGVRYNTVEIDGRTWMASNLAYLPLGATVSSDPSSGKIFYPYSSDGTTATPLTDNASILAKGYLYRIETALGGVTLDDDNFSSFEGARGICPEGWHIPTSAEILGLVGKSAFLETNTAAPYYDKTSNNGQISLINADGFNVDAYGAVSIIDNTKTAATLMGYSSDKYPGIIYSGYICGSSYAGVSYNTKDDASSGVKNLQFHAFMPMANNGTINGSKLSYRIAASVRCVKD